MHNNYHCLLLLGSLFGAATAGKVAPSHAPPPADATGVVDFWRNAGKSRWFAKDDEFDRDFCQRFLALHEAAARGELGTWQESATGALGLVLLLDQFPRNSFRGTPRMYATDTRARSVADQAIRAGHDLVVDPTLRLFMYLPFGHSEDLADQERSVEFARRALSPVDLVHAEHHRDIVRRFGRFPHRNAILGRVSRPDEVRYLAEGGFAG
jgi:uncharacterized protein (DUF924 family)